MHIDYRQIGQHIKAVRKKRKLTQEWLAERLDVSVGYISQIERGITKISLDLLAAIATALDCDISLFLQGVTMEAQSYLENEFYNQWKQLTPENRRLVIKIVGCIIEQQQS
ncbi:MAG: helix-turn-helix transcriptional regulator [Oscillospiraceae bacterium]|nr:helix-turn-helix transcriptional regulator [Oscillospiraceae bacterium]